MKMVHAFNLQILMMMDIVMLVNLNNKIKNKIQDAVTLLDAVINTWLRNLWMMNVLVLMDMKPMILEKVV